MAAGRTLGVDLGHGVDAFPPPCQSSGVDTFSLTVPFVCCRQDVSWERSNPEKFPGRPPVFVDMKPSKGVMAKAKGLLKSLSSGSIKVT